MTEAIVVLCTAPDIQTAERLARGLVAERLAACVNVISGARSFYLWNGNVQDASEQQLIIKTTEARYPEVERWLKEAHPYDVPELVALSISSGSPEYLGWIADSVTLKP